MGLWFSIFGVKKKSVAGLMTRFLYVSMKESPFNKRAQMSEKCFEEHCNCTILAELSKMQTRHLDVKSRFKTLAWKKKGLHKQFWVTLSGFKTLVMQWAFDGSH